jgi:hypothetical protein
MLVGDNTNKGLIYNAIGKLVLSQSVTNETSVTLDLSHLPNGIYFVSVFSREGLHTKKLIVNRP